MRTFGALVLVMTGCFSLSDEAATPERSEGHNEMRRDAGTFDDAGVRDDAGAGADAGPQESSNSPCQQSCDAENWCFWKSENSNYSADCHSVKIDEPAADSLRTMTQGRCVNLGDICTGDDQCRERNNEGRDRCIDFGETEPKCGRPDEICPSGDSDCDGDRPCVEFPLERQTVEQMHGRCVYDDHDFDDLRDGRLGYILDDNSCGLLACYDDPEASCSLYLEGMQDFNPAATVVDCAHIPESDDAETCDWRECEDNSQCERRYFTSGAVCDDGWCAIGAGNSRRYFNQMLHGMAVQPGSLGVQPCRDICGNGNPGAGGGAFCRLQDENSGQLACISCQNNAGCDADSGLTCQGGRCVFPCESEGDCISGQRCDDGRCVEDHQQMQGGPCDDPNINCDRGYQCQEIRAVDSDGEQWVHPHCAQATCGETSLCEPGLRCEPGPGREPHCQFTDLCNTNEECGDVNCDKIVDGSDIEQPLCLLLGSPCTIEENCRLGGRCILGFCGTQVAQNEDCSGEVSYTRFAGTCAPNNPPPRDCGELGCDEDEFCWGDGDVLSACVPEVCDDTQLCPMQMACIAGRCAFNGFCNDESDCQQQGFVCASGQPLCLYAPDSYCDCGNDDTCILGLCNNTAAADGSCSDHDDHQEFTGTCQPN